MARQRIPTKLLALKGAYEKNPKRAKEREGEPQINRLGPVNPLPPVWMNKEQAKAYHLVLKRAHPDVLCDADSGIVETLACYVAEFQADPIGMRVEKVGKMINMYSLLGMTPSDRSRVKVITNTSEKKSEKIADVLSMF